MAKQIIYLIVTAQVILSCTSTTKDSTTWSAFEEKIYNTKKDFEKSGITQPIAISSFFEGNGFEQIPCEEKTYNLSENSERNGNEVVFFVKQEGDEVGFFAITLEPFIVQCNSFNFEGQPLDFYYKGDQQYLVEEKKAYVRIYVHEDFTNIMTSFKYNHILYSEGASVPTHK